MPSVETKPTNHPEHAGLAVLLGPVQLFWLAALLGVLSSAFVLFGAPLWREWGFRLIVLISTAAPVEVVELRALEKRVNQVQSSISRLQQRHARFTPQSPYLIIDTADNRMMLRSGNTVIHQSVCSSGSYVLLEASHGQKWMFATPRGQFYVQGKITNPVWRMPDWAFIEEGKAVPAPDSPERYERGVLGDYALAFGRGYFVHGTLYQRMLGMPVTHGCIRLGDEDLRIVYENLQVGSKIFVY